MWLQLKLVLFALTLCRGQNVHPKNAGLVSMLKEMGFPPYCISQSLELCEDNQSSSLLQEMQAQLKQIIDSNKELKSDIKLKSVSQESKLDFKELKTVVENSNSTIEEIKSVVEESNSKIDGMESVVRESNSVIKELKSDVENLKMVIRSSARNCADLLKMGDTESGVQTVNPFSGNGHRPVPVFCDQTTDGGGWTVIQRRADLPQREDFFRGWVDYQLGFGNLTGEFWLGLDNIHALVNETQMELRVDLEDFDGEKRWAKYDLFHIEDSAGKYRLKLGDYQGDAGDSLSYHNNQQFSTKDADHDSYPKTNCAEKRKGAWWYNNCSFSNLNGFQHRGSYERSASGWKDGIYWDKFRGGDYSFKSTQMSVRPRLQN